MLVGCSSTQEKRLADGSWQIRCGEAMNRCASRADVICGDRGYQVLGGGTQGKMLGGTTGYRARVGVAELFVRCGEESARDEEAADAEAAGAEPRSAPPRSAEPLDPPKATRAEPQVAGRAPSQAPLCVPGATQLCVGPGGCSGGQACARDGSGFEPCDCGQSTTTPSGAAAPNSMEHVDGQAGR
jgi:hypothetical protein